MNIRLIKKMDTTIGSLGAFLLSHPSLKDQLFNPKTFLFIRPGGIGDAVMLAPVIRSLKNNSSKVHISVLAEQRNKEVFSLIPGVDKVLCYDRFSEFLQVLRGRYDVVIDTEQWHRLSAIVARIVQAPLKIGFDTNERRKMFTHPVPYSQDAYEADNFCCLLDPLGEGFNGLGRLSVLLTVPTSVAEKAASLLESLGKQPFMAIFPGASILERRWGADRFRRVAEVLTSFGIKIVVVGGKEDRIQGNEIVAGGNGINLAGLTNLTETAAVLAKSLLLLSGDSGVLHIAVGLGVPTVSLFGPGRSKKWAPRGDRHIVINKELTCSPCTTFGTTPPCPNNLQCMQDITLEEVFYAARRLLRNRPNRNSLTPQSLEKEPLPLI